MAKSSPLSFYTSLRISFIPIYFLFFIIFVLSSSSSSFPSLSLPLLPSVSPLPSGPFHFHILPHSHCDPGWLQPFEGYYTSDVHMILDNVLQQLISDPTGTRRFVWSEISFFSRWYEVLNPTSREKLKELILSGKFEFVNGGWSQNDEANPDPQSIIQQITVGHQYLKNNFGVHPRVAYQIDPFGHSSVSPSLFRLMGFESLIINRIPYNMKDMFKSKSMMEFIWKGAEMGGGNTTESSVEGDALFTHVLHAHYSAPKGFDWEENSTPIDDYSVDIRATSLVEELKQRSSAYRSHHLLVPFGDDFKFKAAERQFSNMGRIIDHINKNTERYGATIRYSTASEYLNAVHDEVISTGTIKFPVLQGDFFPYADNEESWWTGFYTTRPLLKQKSRFLSSQLRHAELLHAIIRSHSGGMQSTSGNSLSLVYWEEHYKSLQVAREESALFLHHDAITGTSKANVVTDYLERMDKAADRLFTIQSSLLSHFVTKEPNPPLSLSATTLAVDSFAQWIPLAVFNSMGWERTSLHSTHVKSQFAEVKIVSPNGEIISPPCQIDKNVNLHELSLSSSSPSNSFTVHFLATVPAIGSLVAFVRVHKEAPAGSSLCLISSIEVMNSNGNGGGDGKGQTRGASGGETIDLSISNSFFSLQFSPSTGLLESLSPTTKYFPSSQKILRTIRQSFFHWTTNRGGAYIFRPLNAQTPHPSSVTIVIQKGELTSAVLSNYNGFEIMMRVVNSGEMHLDSLIRHSVSMSAGLNEEWAMRFNVDIESGSHYYTHNGLEFRRRGNGHENIAANFYPTVWGSRLADPSTLFTVYNAHSCGSAALANGELTYLIHRHLGQDDGRGLGEPVSDSSNVKMEFLLQFDPSHHFSTTDFKRQAILFNNPPLLFISSQKFETIDAAISVVIPVNTAAPSFLSPLPSNVHLFSMTAMDSVGDEFSLRIHHLDDPEESTKAVTFSANFKEIFSPKEFFISEARRATLDIVSTWADLSSPHQSMWKFNQYRDGGVTSISDFQNVKWGSSGGQNQNSDEAGVFLSQAALDRMKMSGNTKRTLLEAQQSPFLSPRSIQISLSPQQLQTFVVRIGPNKGLAVPADLPVMVSHLEEIPKEIKKIKVAEKVTAGEKEKEILKEEGKVLLPPVTPPSPPPPRSSSLVDDQKQQHKTLLLPPLPPPPSSSRSHSHSSSSSFSSTLSFVTSSSASFIPSRYEYFIILSFSLFAILYFGVNMRFFFQNSFSLNLNGTMGMKSSGVKKWNNGTPMTGGRGKVQPVSIFTPSSSSSSSSAPLLFSSPSPSPSSSSSSMLSNKGNPNDNGHIGVNGDSDGLSLDSSSSWKDWSGKDN